MRQGSRKPIVLLTGASGFIGRNIVEAITARGETDLRFLARPTAVLPESSEASIYVGDVTDGDSLKSALAGADTIVNAATYTGTDALKATQVNSDGTRNLLEAAARNAAEPEPMSVARLLLHIQDKITGPQWSASTDCESSLSLLRQSGFTSHQAALLSQDHWYQSDRLWALTGLNPPDFAVSAEAVCWYRRFTTGSPPELSG